MTREGPSVRVFPSIQKLVDVTRELEEMESAWDLNRVGSHRRFEVLPWEKGSVIKGMFVSFLQCIIASIPGSVWFNFLGCREAIFWWNQLEVTDCYKFS